MPSQSMSGSITPVGEITEIRIGADNPQGFIFPAGSLEVAVSVGNQSIEGSIAPVGNLTSAVLDTQCFPIDYNCVGAEAVAFDCIGVCDDNTVTTPPTECPECPECPDCEECEECPECPECPPVTDCCLLCGDVTPEGNVAGDVGCIYQFTAASAAALDHPVYGKVSGSDETGWSPLYGLIGSGADSLRVGLLADADGVDSIAVGHSPQAIGLRSIAIGLSAVGNSIDSIVIGHSAADQALGDLLSEGSIAIGRGNAAGSDGNVVIGDTALITHLGFEGFDLGFTVDETSYNSVAIGFEAECSDAQAIAIGDNAFAKGTCSEAIGFNAICYHSLAVALGSQANANTQASIAIGFGAVAGYGEDPAHDFAYQIAIGFHAFAGFNADGVHGKKAIAIGPDAIADMNYAIALGCFANTNTDNQLMLGGADVTTGMREVRFNGGGAASPDICPNVVFGNAARLTTATEGFPYIPTCAGPPTGVPHAYAGTVPLIYDTTNHKLYAYDGGWKAVTLS